MQTTLFADQIELFRDTNRVVAQGNVAFATAEGRISPNVSMRRLERHRDIQTASGLMSLGAQADRRQFGNQEADVYFYGDVIERLGPRRIGLRGRLHHVRQPTPRWEVTSGTVTLNLNDYAIARGTVLRERRGAVSADDPTRFAKTSEPRVSCCPPTAHRRSAVRSSVTRSFGPSIAALTPPSSTTGIRAPGRGPAPKSLRGHGAIER